MEGKMAVPVRLNVAQPVRKKSFSELAESKMWDLLKDAPNQIGTKFTGSHSGKKETDCITYVRETLEYAFEKSGDSAGASGVRAHYQKGTDLARFLSSRGWSGYYWNPNSKHPKDGNPEHPLSYRQAKAGVYYAIPVKGLVV